MAKEKKPLSAASQTALDLVSNALQGVKGQLATLLNDKDNVVLSTILAKATKVIRKAGKHSEAGESKKAASPAIRKTGTRPAAPAKAAAKTPAKAAAKKAAAKKAPSKRPVKKAAKRASRKTRKVAR